MRTFKIKGIKFYGNFPRNKQLRGKFIESDFFKYLNREPADTIEYTIGQNNQMFTTKKAEVNPKLGHAIMYEASNTICRERKIYKGLQRVLLELMSNANNHANLQERGVNHWWLSVNHNKDQNTVSFIFVDYGIGIFKSLKNKPKSKE